MAFDRGEQEIPIILYVEGLYWKKPKHFCFHPPPPTTQKKLYVPLQISSLSLSLRFSSLCVAGKFGHSGPFQYKPLTIHASFLPVVVKNSQFLNNDGKKEIYINTYVWRRESTKQI
jgi:hypothetical protein